MVNSDRQTKSYGYLDETGCRYKVSDFLRIRNLLGGDSCHADCTFDRTYCTCRTILDSKHEATTRDYSNLHMRQCYGYRACQLVFSLSKCRSSSNLQLARLTRDARGDCKAARFPFDPVSQNPRSNRLNIGETMIPSRPEEKKVEVAPLEEERQAFADVVFKAALGAQVHCFPRPI
jgi:hypothetical protein